MGKIGQKVEIFLNEQELNKKGKVLLCGAPSPIDASVGQSRIVVVRNGNIGEYREFSFEGLSKEGGVEWKVINQSVV